MFGGATPWRSSAVVAGGATHGSLLVGHPPTEMRGLKGCNRFVSKNDVRCMMDCCSYDVRK